MQSNNPLWAKSTGETLFEHTEKVVSVISQLCDNLPYNGDRASRIRRECRLSAVFHDCGKAALGFEKALHDGTRWGHRHEVLSAACASEISSSLSQEGILSVLTHHKSILPDITTSIKGCLPAEELPYGNSLIWQKMRSELLSNQSRLIDTLRDLSAHLNVPIEIPDSFSLSNFGIDERLLMRDMQRKDKNFDRKLASVLRGLLITSDHIASAGLSALPAPPVMCEHVENICRKELKGFKLLPFQQRCADTVGNAILKAPTGSGKTAAALLWAAKNQAKNGRLFYVLPHTASINAMHKRLSGIFGDDKTGVLHHKNAAYLLELLGSEDDNAYDRQKLNERVAVLSSLAREMYHPIKVTTPHQILRIALRGKGWETGLSEFENACFVFDEVHAFEPLLTGLTVVTVKWLKSMGAKFLFVSATMPYFLETILAGEVGIDPSNIIAPCTDIPEDNDMLSKVRHQILVRDGSLLDNIENVIQEIEQSGETALVVCNHVATSQKVFEMVRRRLSDVKLLHSRFNNYDRMKIEREIQAPGTHRVLVATQAVEVSLDLDYDRGYSEPAPADACGQRFGRINRKGKRKHPAPIVIFSVPSLKAKKSPLFIPYDKEITMKTVDLFRSADKLTESGLTGIVDRVYSNGYEVDDLADYNRGLNNADISNFDERIVAGAHLDWVSDVIDGTDGQMELLPDCLLDKYKKLITEKLFVDARGLLVPVMATHLKHTSVIFFDKTFEEFVTTLEYSSETGLNLQKKTENIY